MHIVPAHFPNGIWWTNQNRIEEDECMENIWYMVCSSQQNHSRNFCKKHIFYGIPRYNQPRVYGNHLLKSVHLMLCEIEMDIIDTIVSYDDKFVRNV